MEDSSHVKDHDDLIVEVMCALWKSLSLTVVYCCFCARSI